MIAYQNFKTGRGLVSTVAGECGRFDGYSLAPAGWGPGGWVDFTRELRETLPGQLLITTKYSPLPTGNASLGLNYETCEKTFQEMEAAGWIRGLRYPGNHVGKPNANGAFPYGYMLQVMYLVLHPELKDQLEARWKVELDEKAAAAAEKAKLAKSPTKKVVANV